MFRFENLAAGSYIMVQDFDEPSQGLQDYQAFAPVGTTIVSPDGPVILDLAADQNLDGFFFTETIAGG